jgi:hypothetical protein
MVYLFVKITPYNRYIVNILSKTTDYFTNFRTALPPLASRSTKI